MKKILFLFSIVLMFVSCEPTYEKEYNWAYPVSGDWMVKVYIGEEEDAGPMEIKTYNSSYGKDSIWIDDYPAYTYIAAYQGWYWVGNYWGMKVKIPVNMKTKTFSTDSISGSVNGLAEYPIKIKVLNGKIIGNDSIYFEVQYEDDSPSFGTTYKFAGHRETSYEEYMGQ